MKEGLEIVAGYPMKGYNKSKGIYIERFPEHTDEWHQRRSMGIGASEIGKLLGLNDYQGGSSLELFLEKIGLKPPFREGNKFTHYGKMMEAMIAEQWSYYDGSDGSEITNYANGKVIRKCHNVNGMLTNERYVDSDGLPILFASLDRAINKGAFRLTDASELTENVPLELKTASSWVTKKWEDGVPPMYLAQTYQQMMVMDVPYSEIAILELDNRVMSVYPVIKNEAFVERIEDNMYTFWEDMVKPGKILVKELNWALEKGNQTEVQRIEAELQRIEPGADGSESYKSFMNQRYLSEDNKVVGDEIDLENAAQLVYIKQLAKDLVPMVTLRENKIRERLESFDTLDFSDMGFGKVTWKTDKRGARVMRTGGFKYPGKEEWSQDHLDKIQLPELPK